MRICPVCARPVVISGCLGNKRNVIDYHEVCENPKCGKYSIHTFDGVEVITINSTKRTKGSKFYLTKESLIRNNICNYGTNNIPENRPSITYYLGVYGLTMEQYKSIISADAERCERRC